PAQPVQPAARRVPRRRPDRPRVEGRAPDRLAGRGADRGAVHRARAAPRRLHVGDPRSAAPALARVEDRRLFRREDPALDGRVAMTADEFRRGFEAVDRIDRPPVTVFGSARIGEAHPAYAAARETGRLLAEAGFAVVTGGGGGAMEAANRGARE